MVGNTSVAAATATVGYDIAKDKNWRQRSYDRILTKIGSCGSTAAGDCEFEAMVNGVNMGAFRNITTGWPTKDHMMDQAIPIPANALLELLMTIAPTTNPINVIVEFAP